MSKVIKFPFESKKGGSIMSVCIRPEWVPAKKDALRFIKIVLFFANNSSQKLYKTKLNKLLFYTQFLYHKKFHEKLLQDEFICDHYGPVLEHLDAYLDILAEINSITLKETDYGTIIVPEIAIDDSAYNVYEMEILANILKAFDHCTARQISQYSHEESLWINTPLKEVIPVKRSYELRDV